MSVPLSELARLSQELNDESAKVNEIISRENQSLGSINLGLTVWLDTFLFDSERHKFVQLGYTNVEDRWQTAIRNVVIDERKNVVDASAPQPLVRVSRPLRIEAVELLSELRNAIKIRLERLLRSIEKANDASSELDLARNSRANVLRCGIDELEISVRTYNCLRNAKIRTVNELVKKSEAEMLQIGNFSQKSLKELKALLAAMDLSLGMQIDEDDNPTTKNANVTFNP